MALLLAGAVIAAVLLTLQRLSSPLYSFVPIAVALLGKILLIFLLCRTPVLSTVFLVAVRLISAILAADVLAIHYTAILLDVVVLVVIFLAATVLATVMSASLQPHLPQYSTARSFLPRLLLT